jgi:hypothetical protein
MLDVTKSFYTVGLYQLTIGRHTCHYIIPPLDAFTNSKINFAYSQLSSYRYDSTHVDLDLPCVPSLEVSDFMVRGIPHKVGQDIPAYYETRRIIIMFTTHHWTTS